MSVTDLKKVSIDSLVTSTKLQGSSIQIQGFTKPEGWPFVVVVAVAKPGNEAMLALVKRFGEEAAKLSSAVSEQHWASWPGKDKTS